MNERTRGRSTRTPNPTLPTLLESSATDAFKAEVRHIFDQLASQDTLDRTILVKTDPELLARIDVLSGAGLDLFRVLRGEKPLKTTYTRQNVSASLRHKLHEQAGQLSDASYADGHIVPLMAKVYWGSIEAWVEGRPGRACRPKGYWLKPENQRAALLDWAASHPGEPLTHATLQKAGLCALAVALDGTALASLAAKLGLQRNFRRRPNGFWTRAVVMEMYAELCRTHGITLSSVALGAIGGDGYTLRDRAARLFGGFAAFQAAVAARYPDIRLPVHPRREMDDFLIAGRRWSPTTRCASPFRIRASTRTSCSRARVAHATSWSAEPATWKSSATARPKWRRRGIRTRASMQSSGRRRWRSTG